MSIETGNRLAQLRKAKGLSQEELASQLGVSRQAVSKWETGESSPDTDNLIALAKIYGISLDELINGTETPKSESEPIEPEVVDSNEDDDDDDDEDDDEEIVIKKQSKGGPSAAQRAVNSVGFIVALVVYLLVGFLWKGPTGALGWASMWVLFLVPVVISSLIAAIEDRKPSEFQVAVLIVGVYCAMGIIGSAYGQNFWHPYWVEFLFIPIYHAVTGAIERAIKKN